MELTTRIFVFLMIVATGLGAGVALGRAHFNPGSGQQEIAVAAEEDDDDLPAQYTNEQSRIPFALDAQLFGEFVILR